MDDGRHYYPIMAAFFCIFSIDKDCFLAYNVAVSLLMFITTKEERKMNDFHKVYLAIHSLNLPGVFHVYRESRIKKELARSRNGSATPILNVQGFIDLITIPLILSDSIPLPLVNPENGLSESHSPSLAFLSPREIIQANFLSIPLVLPGRIAGLVDPKNGLLRISFCGRDLYDWHNRFRPDYTSPWSDRFQFGLTLWEYCCEESPLFDILRHFPIIRSQELATFCPTKS